MRPELEEYGKRLTEIHFNVLDEDEHYQRWLEEAKSPLFWEYILAIHDENEELDRKRWERYCDGLRGNPKANLPALLMRFIEDLSPAYDVSPKDNLTWQTAEKAETAYQKMLEARRSLLSAQGRLNDAQREYERLMRTDIGLQMYFRNLEPFKGTFPDDPLTWFLTTDEVIERARTQLGLEVTPSQLRYYSRQGLLTKPVRAGRGGRALYPVTVILRLQLIQWGQREGASIRVLAGAMSMFVKHAIQGRAKNRGDIYHEFARLASPKSEEHLRWMMDMVAEEEKKKEKRKERKKTNERQV